MKTLLEVIDTSDQEDIISKLIMRNWRKDLTNEQRVKWDVENYRRRLESNRGRNFKYLTDDVYHELIRKGYCQHYFKCKEFETSCESLAVEKRDELREKGFYASIYCVSNKLRIKSYTLWFRECSK